MKATVMARYLGASVTFFGILFGLMQPANAWYDICNKSSYSVYVAFGYHDGGNWVSEGWWDLVPGECATVYEGALANQKYYVYGESYDEDYYWDGDYPFCGHDDAFTIVGDTGCKSRGYYELGFFEVDVGESRDWTTDLIE
ncbi:MAG: DUF1036 domain-containing protein [Rhodospirillaceae bacterium]|nr:DUF1036 domain-containing protein [Rhodospirillaceae bacterium]